MKTPPAVSSGEMPTKELGVPVLPLTDKKLGVFESGHDSVGVEEWDGVLIADGTLVPVVGDLLMVWCMG